MHVCECTCPCMPMYVCQCTCVCRGVCTGRKCRGCLRSLQAPKSLSVGPSHVDGDTRAYVCAAREREGVVRYFRFPFSSSMECGSPKVARSAPAFDVFEGKAVIRREISCLWSLCSAEPSPLSSFFHFFVVFLSRRSFC